MKYIAQNSSENVSLSAGQWINVTGTGIATQIAGPTKGHAQAITNSGKVGPFDYAQTMAQFGGIAFVIQNVVDDLEGRSQRLTILGASGFDFS